MTRNLTDDQLHSMVGDMMSRVKFYPRDVCSGRARKIDDEFRAMFMGVPLLFRVVSLHGDFFYAARV